MFRAKNIDDCPKETCNGKLEYTGNNYILKGNEFEEKKCDKKNCDGKRVKLKNWFASKKG